MNENNVEAQAPEFRNGQFVRRVKNGDVVQIYGDPKLSECGNVYWYGISYRKPIRKENVMSSGGGASFSWPESDFEEVVDPIDLLIIAKWEREEEKEKLERRFRVIESEISKIHFSLNLANPILKEDK